MLYDYALHSVMIAELSGMEQELERFKVSYSANFCSGLSRYVKYENSSTFMKCL